jgi:hypothetical protein
VDEGVFADFKTGKYLVSGEFVWLGANKAQYFGNNVVLDLDNDGDQDIAFLMTQDRGADGTRFFLAGAIKEESGYRGTNAMMIGDNVAPQTTEHRDALVLVNYAIRQVDGPSIGKSLYAKYNPESNNFAEVVQNFEGESKN